MLSEVQGRPGPLGPLQQCQPRRGDPQSTTALHVVLCMLQQLTEAARVSSGERIEDSGTGSGASFSMAEAKGIVDKIQVSADT